MRRRLLANLQTEFRAIIYTAANRTSLVGLAADGKSIWLIETVDGSAELLLTKEDDKFTCIRMKQDTENILIGTLKGSLLTFSLKEHEQKLLFTHDQPISLLLDENCFADAKGRVVFKNQIILNDGILQPCALFQDSNTIYFVKHRTVYIFSIEQKSLVSCASIEQGSEDSFYFCAAEMDSNGSLFVVTDTGNVLLLHNQEISYELKQLNLEKGDLADFEGIEDETNVEDDNEGESIPQTEKILSLIRNPACKSELLLLKSDPANKRAWFETIHSSKTSDTVEPGTNLPEFELVQVSCPLCINTEPQNLRLNASKCINNHPITICSLTKIRLDSWQCFRCRKCNAAFSLRPSFCNFCLNLIKK